MREEGDEEDEEDEKREGGCEGYETGAISEGLTCWLDPGEGPVCMYRGGVDRWGFEVRE